MLDLESIKRDRLLLCAELGVDPNSRAPKHVCPFHNEKTGSLQISDHEGHWIFKCFGCGQTGSIVDAVKLKRKLRSNTDAMAAMEKDFGCRFSIKERDDVELIPPEIDLDRCQKFIDYCHTQLLDRMDLQQKWMIDKRGLNLETCIRFKLGFADSKTLLRLYRQWPAMSSACAWVFPVTDSKGVVRAVKLHFENKPMNIGAKSMWAPFGKALGNEKAKHAYPILWPPPEVFPIDTHSPTQSQKPQHIDWGNGVQSWPEDQRNSFLAELHDRCLKQADEDRAKPWNKGRKLDPTDYYEAIGRAMYAAQVAQPVEQPKYKASAWFFLCPGELKALACIATGYAATSVTSGESQKLPQRQIERLAGRMVCVFHDPDEAGLKWRDQMNERLHGVAASIKNISGKKKAS